MANAKPTSQELQASAGKRVPDLIAPGLKVLFVGINPGLYSGATSRHFARPGNRFWPALHLGGITPHRFVAEDEQALLALGYGITALVRRATATAQELRAEEYRAGAQELEEKVRAYPPKLVCFLGIGAYRTGFRRPTAQLGLQRETIAGVPIWVMPNPSGLNAHYSVEDFGRMMAEVRVAAEAFT